MTRERRNRRFLKRAPQKEDVSLQITSMADIFMIILVFLLKSFSTGISNISPSNIVLPEALASDEVHDGTKVEISSKAILLDDKPVTSLDSFIFRRGDVESDGTPRSLNTALLSQAGQEKDRKTGGDVLPQRLVVLADRRTPYSTLSAVLRAASNSGFDGYKLVVVEDR